MTRAHIFPAILCVMYIGAAIMCASVGDYRRMTYWLAAAVLNVSVSI